MSTAKQKIRCEHKGCKAHVLKNSAYCYHHDPKNKKERIKARIRGGLTRSAPKVLSDASYKLKAVSEVKTMLGDVTNAVLTGSIDINRARAAMYGASIIITCIKEDDFEKRLKALEDQVGNIRGK